MPREKVHEDFEKAISAEEFGPLRGRDCESNANVLFNPLASFEWVFNDFSTFAIVWMSREMEGGNNKIFLN